MSTSQNPDIDAQLSEYNRKRYENYRIDKYKTGMSIYPRELTTNPDLQHFVAFYINVREKAKKYSGETFNKNETAVLKSVSNSLKPEEIGTAIPLLSGVQGAILGAGLTSVTDMVKVNKGGKGKPSITPALELGAKTAGAAIGFTTGYYLSKLALEKLDILQQESFLRLKEVICLHIEDRPTVKYGMQYTDKDLGILTGLLGTAGNSSISSLEDLMNAGSLVTEGAALLATTLTKIPGALGGARIGDLLGAYAGVRINPFKESLFESVDYRTFNFKYRFFPKSAAESMSVKRIIELFKLHMHPTLSDNKFFFNYPSEFEIVYYHKDPKDQKHKENPFLFKIASCALTDMAVEYGGDTFSTFDNGAPTQINLVLTFRELEQLTKKEMNLGY